jgi:hypothetical protein
MHELCPPIRYWSMRSFDSRMASDTIIVHADGTVGVDETIKPLWNYVLTWRGELLVAPEDFGFIKHTSIAAGENVWSAGQIGIQGNKLRVADLQSGHYVRGITPESTLGNLLVQFTQDIFKSYFQIFNLANLHSQFECVWT